MIVTVLIESITEISSNSTILFDFEVAFEITFSGVAMIGAVVSTTVMVWVAEAELPEESVAVQVTIVSPSENTSGASLVSVVSWMSIIWGNSKAVFVPPEMVASNVWSEI